MSERTYVAFRFRLPLVLMLRAQPGPWPRAPRYVTVDVAKDGAVVIETPDQSESYARNQVLKTAAAFLREVDDRIGAHVLIGMLQPGNGAAPIRYSIALGARVSITPSFTQAELLEAG